jgi:hypothetical protein
MFDRIVARLDEFQRMCRPRYGALLFAGNEPLSRLAASRGLKAELIPEALISDPSRLAMAAAAHTLCGKVKIASPAQVRALTSPLGGALDIRGGEDTDDPLRAALLVGISLALDDASQASVRTQ